MFVSGNGGGEASGGDIGEVPIVLLASAKEGGGDDRDAAAGALAEPSRPRVIDGQNKR